MRKQPKLAALVLGILASVGGCKEIVRDTSRDFGKEGKVNDYDAVAFIDGEGRHLTIMGGDLPDSGYITALDRDNDGRFDEIKLRYMRKGHPLETYASLERLEQAYNSIVNE